MSRETIVGGKVGRPALQGLAHAFNNNAAAEMHAAATSGQQGRAQPAIPAVHLAPLGTGTGMPGRWVGWLYGGVEVVLPNIGMHMHAKINTGGMLMEMEGQWPQK